MIPMVCFIEGHFDISCLLVSHIKDAMVLSAMLAAMEGVLF
mgnify:CR=1 FL=1